MAVVDLPGAAPHASRVSDRSDVPGTGSETATAVFRGTLAACLEHGLVLDARGILYERREGAGRWELFVDIADAVPAGEELERYAAESALPRREFPQPMVPFRGAAIGVLAYAGVLLATAYCAGIRLFGIDWLERGALDARVGGLGEWWRAITALTLHLDQEHLLGNLLFGMAIGMLAGRMFGPGLAWLSIVGAGACGNYLDMWVSPGWHRAAGASTAVFGALGLVAGYAWRERQALRNHRFYRWAPVFAGTCLLTLLGAGNAHADVLGHVLGFGIGLGLGACYAYWRIPRGHGKLLQLTAAAGTLLIVGIAWWVALRHPR